MEWEILTAYYGLDWLAAMSGLVGLYLITQKKGVGFLVTAASVVVAAGVSVAADQYGFLISNVATLVLALRGYVHWKQVPVVATN